MQPGAFCLIYASNDDNVTCQIGPLAVAEAVENKLPLTSLTVR